MNIYRHSLKINKQDIKYLQNEQKPFQEGNSFINKKTNHLDTEQYKNYNKFLTANCEGKACLAVEKFIGSDITGNILVFLPGLKAMENLKKSLLSFVRAKLCYIYLLHSSLELEPLIYKEGPIRKIVSFLDSIFKKFEEIYSLLFIFPRVSQWSPIVE